MSGPMARYRRLLAETPGPVLPSERPKVKMDLSGMIRYAKSKGVQPASLSDAEKARFIAS